MANKPANIPQPNWLFIGVVTIIAAVIFFQPFLGSIAIAIIVAFLFSPVYRWLAKHMPDKLASGVTVVLSFLAILLPVAIVVSMSIFQGIALAQHMSSLSSETGSLLHTSSQPVTDGINRIFAPLNGGNPVVTQEQVQDVAKKVVPNIIQNLTTAAINFASNIPSLMTGIIVYAFLLNSFLRYGDYARRIFTTISPFETTTNELYIQRAGTIITGSLRGQFIISIITAFFSALLLIPLGSGILMIPICIIAMLAGQFWPAFWVLVVYLGVVCNIDSLLRGKLIPKNAKLIPAITTLATFCGIAYFGLLGIIYGPLIAILLSTTLETFMLYRQQSQPPAPSKLTAT